jgi:cell division transport system permease protein
MILRLAVHVLNGGLAQLAQLYAARIEFGPLSPRDTVVLLAVSTGLGWLGSWLSVSRQLGQIEPR